MSESKTTTLKIEVPLELGEALSWYVRRTVFWVSDEYADKSINELVTYILRGYLQQEADSPSLPVDWIKKELIELTSGLK